MLHLIVLFIRGMRIKVKYDAHIQSQNGMIISISVII